jgi:hypothetical protein
VVSSEFYGLSCYEDEMKEREKQEGEHRVNCESSSKVTGPDVGSVVSTVISDEYSDEYSDDVRTHHCTQHCTHH